MCGHPVTAHLCLVGEAVMVEMDLTYVKCWMWPYVWHVASELRVDMEVKIYPWSSRIAWQCLACVFLQRKTSCWHMKCGQVLTPKTVVTRQ